MQIRWIKGYEGLYTISSDGTVHSYRKRIRGRPVVCLKAQHVMKPGSDGHYLGVGLCQSGKHKSFRIHRLVLEAFIGPCPAGMEACHNNNIKTDNRLGNLRWDTHQSNQVKDGGARGIIGKGESNPMAKLNEYTVRYIKKLGADGWLHGDIALLARTTRRNVSRIIQGERWAHV